MSSPFQKQFSAKDPIKGANTISKRKLDRISKKEDEEMYENAALLPQINQGDYDYEMMDEQEFPGDDRFTYEKKTQVDSPLNSYRSGSGGMAYVSTAGHFQKLQDNITQAFTPKKKAGPTSEDKKNQAEEAYWKSKTTTSEENNPFKDLNKNESPPSLDGGQTFYTPFSKGYTINGANDDSKKGNPFYSGTTPKGENYFNKF